MLSDFESRIEPRRRELVAYCYRMLGSVQEAEDLVQETLPRAWKAWERYDERKASVRTWLYRTATNVCLTALEGKARRPLPSGLGAPSADPDAPLLPAFDVPWLQPFPDARLGEADDPASRVVERGSMRLALIAAMQVLPPRQRAIWVLRELLEFSAAEVAEQLDTSVASVNSALQRARAGLANAGLVEHEIVQPDDRTVQRTVEAYVRAFEAGARFRPRPTASRPWPRTLRIRMTGTGAHRAGARRPPGEDRAHRRVPGPGGLRGL